MLNRKNKKGFTLAELLIVVAIIAVLVAIAVPLFVGALDKAENAVLQANERSLKGMAVTEILTSSGKDGTTDYLYTTKDGTTTPNKYWKVKGSYDSATDTFKIESIDGSAETVSLSGTEKSKKTDDGYELWVLVSYSDLTVTP